MAAAFVCLSARHWTDRRPRFEVGARAAVLFPCTLHFIERVPTSPIFFGRIIKDRLTMPATRRILERTRIETAAHLLGERRYDLWVRGGVSQVVLF
jgi:hypothetical protein